MFQTASPLALPTVEELLRLNEEFETATAEEILAWAASTYAPRFAALSSFGASSGAMLYMLKQVAPETPVIFLDTGYHFQETLAFKEHLEERYGLVVERWAVKGDRQGFLSQYPNDLNKHPDVDGFPIPAAAQGKVKTGVDLCCYLNKVEPLQRALSSRLAYVTSLRRSDHTEVRKRTKIIDVQTRGDGEHLVKINPMANWSKQQLWGYIHKNEVPIHPLFLDGFKSIGCEPCTARVAEGEDERAGRWRGSQKNECGIHTFTSEGI